MRLFFSKYSIKMKWAINSIWETPLNSAISILQTLTLCSNKITLKTLRIFAYDHTMLIGRANTLVFTSYTAEFSAGFWGSLTSFPVGSNGMVNNWAFPAHRDHRGYGVQQPLGALFSAKLVAIPPSTSEHGYTDSPRYVWIFKCLPPLI